jgi:hypothetical protein
MNMNLATLLLPLLLLLSACSPKPAIPLPSYGDYFPMVFIYADKVGQGKVVQVEGTVVTLEYDGPLVNQEEYYTIDWMSVTSAERRD